MKNMDENKIKYFIIAIALLIILGVILILHFGNKKEVSGIKVKESTTTTTTEIITTTKKISTTNDVSSNEVYKSVIDEDNKLVYDYKLTDEIKDTDKIISSILTINEEYKNNNIIGLYDISLYDINNVKKSVNNSLINISIPIVGDLVGYDSYKVVYIKDDVITDEEFNTEVKDGYIKFSTTHLSVYGIIGENKTVSKININDVKVSMLYNDEVVTDNIYVTPKSNIKLVVDGANDYELYYGLRFNDADEVEYVKYIDDIVLSDIIPYEEVTVVAKVVVDEDSKTFEFGKVKVYDVIVDYDRNSEEEVDYTDIKGKNILLNDVTVEEENLEDIDNNIEIENKTAVEIEGNIYLVDKADISNLNITGTLVIDTKEEITFGLIDDDTVSSMGLERIIITSKEFTLNGVDFVYEVIDNKIVITIKVKEEQIDEIVVPVDEAEDTIISESETFFDTDIKVNVDEDNYLIIEFVRPDEEDLNNIEQLS